MRRLIMLVTVAATMAAMMALAGPAFAYHPPGETVDPYDPDDCHIYEGQPHQETGGCEALFIHEAGPDNPFTSGEQPPPPPDSTGDGSYTGGTSSPEACSGCDDLEEGIDDVNRFYEQITTITDYADVHYEAVRSLMLPLSIPRTPTELTTLWPLENQLDQSNTEVVKDTLEDLREQQQGTAHLVEEASALDRFRVWLLL